MAGSRRLPIQARATSWVRATDSIRTNSPDGWVADQEGPAWWLSTDSTPPEMDWSAYGMRLDPPFLNPLRTHRYGGRPVSSGQLSGRGVLGAVTRATNLIIGPVVRTTWAFNRGARDLADQDVRTGQSAVRRPLWVIDPQLVGRIPGGELGRPTLPYARRLGAHAFWRTLLAHCLWWGTGAEMHVEDAFGQPLAGTMRIVNPTRWAYTDDGRFVLDPDGDEPLESDYDGVFDVGSVQWVMRTIHNFAPVDGMTPSGALVRAGLAVLAGERMNNYLATVLNSGVPAGVLKVSTPSFGATDAAALKQTWMAAHGGSRKSVAVLNSGIDFVPLSLSVVDADVVNAMGANLVSIAHAFNLSASALDSATGSGGGNITYANIGERRRDHLDHSLADLGRSLEDFITALLPFDITMRADWSGYLSTDPSQQLEFVKQGLELGYMSKDEARDRLGMAPSDEMSTPGTPPGNPLPLVENVEPAPEPEEDQNV